MPGCLAVAMLGRIGTWAIAAAGSPDLHRLTMKRFDCTRGSGTGRLAVMLLAVLALALSGFAHRPAAITQTELAFLLPDGSVADICLNSGEEDNSAHAGSCDFCRLAAAPGLPAMPQQASRTVFAECAVAVLQASAPLKRLAHLEGAPTRGPPVSFLA